MMDRWETTPFLSKFSARTATSLSSSTSQNISNLVGIFGESLIEIEEDAEVGERKEGKSWSLFEECESCVCDRVRQRNTPRHCLDIFGSGL